MAIRDKLARRLEALDNSDTALALTRTRCRRAMALARESAAVSESRREAATRFAELLMERSRPLGMHNLRCEIAVSQAQSLSATGIDEISFLLPSIKPTADACWRRSFGGEISRLMLSIKSIIADRMELPSIIFDEVDTGGVR